MHSRRKSGSNHESRNGCREREVEREKRKRRVHLSPECVECVRHPRFASLPSLREPPPQPGPPAIISFLFIQHIVSGLRVVRRSIRHRLFLPAAGRPAVIYFGTEIRFAKHRTAYCVPHRKAAFIVIFTFTSWATPWGSGAMRVGTSIRLFFSSFFGRT